MASQLALTDVDPDTWATIGQYLPVEQLASMRRCCKSLYHQLSCNDTLWGEKFRTVWPLWSPSHPSVRDWYKEYQRAHTAAHQVCIDGWTCLDRRMCFIQAVFTTAGHAPVHVPATLVSPLVCSGLVWHQVSPAMLLFVFWVCFLRQQLCLNVMQYSLQAAATTCTAACMCKQHHKHHIAIIKCST